MHDSDHWKPGSAERSAHELFPTQGWPPIDHQQVPGERQLRLEKAKIGSVAYLVDDLGGKDAVLAGQDTELALDQAP